MPNFDFQPGDIVSFCGDEAVVVSNWGRSGTVCQGDQTMEWQWVFEGEPVKLVRRANERN